MLDSIGKYLGFTPEPPEDKLTSLTNRRDEVDRKITRLQEDIDKKPKIATEPRLTINSIVNKLKEVHKKVLEVKKASLNAKINQLKNSTLKAPTKPHETLEPTTKTPRNIIEATNTQDTDEAATKMQDTLKALKEPISPSPEFDLIRKKPLPKLTPELLDMQKVTASDRKESLKSYAPYQLLEIAEEVVEQINFYVSTFSELNIKDHEERNNTNKNILIELAECLAEKGSINELVTELTKSSPTTLEDLKKASPFVNSKISEHNFNSLIRSAFQLLVDAGISKTEGKALIQKLSECTPEERVALKVRIMAEKEGIQKALSDPSFTQDQQSKLTQALNYLLDAETGLAGSIVNDAIENAQKPLQKYKIDLKTINEPEIKGKLTNLTPEERLQLRKEIYTGIEGLEAVKNDTTIPDFSKVIVRKALADLEKLKDFVVDIVKEKANAHLLEVLKGNPSAVKPESGRSIKSMQEAFLAANAMFMKTEDFFSLIVREINRADCPQTEKVALLDFLKKWADRNAVTLVTDAGNERPIRKALINKVRVIQGFDDDKSAIITALTSAKAPVSKNTLPITERRFAEVVDQLLANRFGSDEAYKEQVKKTASDFLQLQLDDYLSLTPDDLIYDKWDKRAGDTNPSSIKDVRIRELSNTMSAYVTSLITSKTTDKERADLIKFFLDVAAECHNQGNLAAASAIYGGAYGSEDVKQMKNALALLDDYGTVIQNLYNTYGDSTKSNANILKLVQERNKQNLPTLSFFGATKGRILKDYERKSINIDSEEYNFQKFEEVNGRISGYLQSQGQLRAQKTNSVHSDLFLQIREYKK